MVMMMIDTIDNASAIEGQEWISICIFLSLITRVLRDIAYILVKRWTNGVYT